MKPVVVFKISKCPKHGETEFYLNGGGCRQCRHERRTKKKQRIGENFEDAKENFLAKFHGKPCIRCGSTIRYTTQKICVPCTINRVGNKYIPKKSNRQIAIENGENKYASHCEKHGETWRYTYSRECHFCRSEYRRFFYHWQKAIVYVREMLGNGIEPTVLLLKLKFDTDTVTAEKILRIGRKKK